jgi:hypothetical protein
MDLPMGNEETHTAAFGYHNVTKQGEKKRTDLSSAYPESQDDAQDAQKCPGPESRRPINCFIM